MAVPNRSLSRGKRDSLDMTWPSPTGARAEASVTLWTWRGRHGLPAMRAFRPCKPHPRPSYGNRHQQQHRGRQLPLRTDLRILRLRSPWGQQVTEHISVFGQEELLPPPPKTANSRASWGTGQDSLAGRPQQWSLQQEAKLNFKKVTWVTVTASELEFTLLISLAYSKQHRKTMNRQIIHFLNGAQGADHTRSIQRDVTE